MDGQIVDMTLNLTSLISCSASAKRRAGGEKFLTGDVNSSVVAYFNLFLNFCARVTTNQRQMHRCQIRYHYGVIFGGESRASFFRGRRQFSKSKVGFVYHPRRPRVTAIEEL